MSAGRATKQRVTLADVANHAGVSVATVSKAVRDAYGISEAMQSKVLAAVEELGYRPDRLARGMRGSTRTIGLLVTSIDNSFVNLVVQNVSKVLGRAGYDVFISSARPVAAAQDAAIDALIDHQMDGLVLIGTRQDPEQLERVGRTTPIVAVGRHGPANSFDTVASDDRRGSRLVVDHLVGLGHRQITFVAESTEKDYETLLECVRLDGYSEAMTAHGLSSEIDVIHTTWTHEGGREAAEDLLRRTRRPTAVYAGADVAAIGMLNRFWQEDVEVPAALSLVGYDNSPIGSLVRIGLTSVDQGGELMGERAAELLLTRIAGRADSQHQLLPPRLQVRTTTAAPSP